MTRTALPLQGVTILAVEDSRYACEAMRLMCQRAGARLRRAETLQAARAHLRLYRPDVVVIDLGLPDGRGEALIRDLVLGAMRPPVILGTSGLPAGRTSALAAGADGFIEKPLESLAAFCAALGAFLPETAGAGVQDEVLHPDPLALRDDLARAASRLETVPDAAARRYVTGFVAGIAHHAHDQALAFAASEAGLNPDLALDGLRHLIDRRLAHADAGFAPAHRP
jgi:DNA-binding response OmpR family regulator